MIKMKTLLRAAAALSAGLLIFSCSKDKVTELIVTPLQVNVDVAGATDKTVSITCNDAWTATSGADWLTVSPASGNGNATITLNISANTSIEARETEITIKAAELTRTVKVGQLGQEPALALDKDALSFIALGSAPVEVTVTSNVPWTVSIPADATWLAANPTSGTGNGTVTFTVTDNIYRKSNTAQVTILGSSSLSSTLTVTQDMAPLSRQTDSLALVAIYNAANGANWKDGRVWDLTKAMDDPDNKWYGVTLNTDGRVTMLKLLANTITAEWELPAEIADLTELTDFRINTCSLKGSIPEGVYSLTKLQKLYFQANNLSGTLSTKISQLTALSELYINDNTALGGSPSFFGALTSLTKVNCSKTAISGAIPDGIGGNTGLTDILVNDNAGITGEIPASLGNLAGVKNINLSNCNLTGNIPASFGNLPSTCTSLILKGNKLSGVVPAAVQAHAKWQATTAWKYSTNILPQQSGFELKLTE